MGKQYRPRYSARKDKTHHVVSKVINDLGGVYGGLPLYLIDTSSQGGEVLDWILWVGALSIAIEVKQEENPSEFKPGEIAFLNNCPGLVAVVQTEQDVTDLLSDVYYLALLLQKEIDHVTSDTNQTRRFQKYIRGSTTRDRAKTD